MTDVHSLRRVTVHLPMLFLRLIQSVRNVTLIMTIALIKLIYSVLINYVELNEAWNLSKEIDMCGYKFKNIYAKGYYINIGVMYL